MKHVHDNKMSAEREGKFQKFIFIVTRKKDRDGINKGIVINVRFRAGAV